MFLLKVYLFLINNLNLGNSNFLRYTVLLCHILFLNNKNDAKFIKKIFYYQESIKLRTSETLKGNKYQYKHRKNELISSLRLEKITILSEIDQC